MKPAPLSYARATAVDGALSSLRSLPDGRVISGGQSLGPMLNLRLAQPENLVDISRVTDLRGATAEDGRLVIGACVTHAEIEDGTIPDVTRGLMPLVAHGIAYRAVRNRGTIGGSLAHSDPAADWVTTMIAVDASVRLEQRSGARELKVAAFIKAPLQTALEEGEILTHILVPCFSAETRWGRAKYAKKLGDFAQSMAVVVGDATRGAARAVLGRRADVPTLLNSVSALLSSEGHAVNAQALESAIDADLMGIQVDAADFTLHRAIISRAVRDLAV